MCARFISIHLYRKNVEIHIESNIYRGVDRYKELIAIRENEKQPRELLKLSADSLLGVNCCHCRICIAKIVREIYIKSSIRHFAL